MKQLLARCLSVAAGVAAFALVTPSVRAGEITGQDLYNRLTLPTTTGSDMAYAMFLVGNVLFQWDGKSHCKPPKATLAQAVAITKNFLADNPHLWHEESPYLIAVALGEKWPCNVSQKGK